jgi:Leucine-rich repeat (LRR) protein
MKARLRCALGTALALVITTFGGTTAHAEQTVDIPDPSLHACIAQQLQDFGLDASFTATNLAQLSQLSCSTNAAGDIADLTGIDELSGLRYLFLGDLTARNLDPLPNMTWLTSLVVRDKVLTSAAPLASLTGLTRLWLETPGVGDVSFLARMPGVHDLELDVAPGTDLSTLSALAGLQALIVKSRPGTDLSPIGARDGLQHLQLNLAGDETALPELPLPASLESLGIDGPALESLAGLRPGPNVTFLGLWTAGLTSLTGISVLPRVETLYARSARIAVTTGLADLTNLKDADLSGNRIASTLDLAGLTKLQKLDLSGNQLADLSGLAGLTNLTTLGLSFNRITELDSLGALTKLEDLSLAGNQVTQLGALSGLAQLRKLTLSGNRITTLDGLGKLNALTRLDLSGNQLSSLDGLPAATTLSQLNIARNQLNDVAPLAGFAALTDLDAGDNFLVGLGPKGTFSHLTRGMFKGNHLASIAGLEGIGTSTLDLNDNDLTDITVLAGVGADSTIYLARNRLRDLAALPDKVTFYAPDQRVSYPDATVGVPVDLGIRSVSGAALCPVFEPAAPCANGTVTYPRSGTYQAYVAQAAPSGPNQFSLAFTVHVGPDRVFARTYKPTVGNVPFVGTSVQPRYTQWAPRPDDYTYQWYRDGKLIPGDGAHEFNYVAVAADLGHRLSVCVTGHLNGYTPATRCSGRSVKVGKGEVSDSARPKITGVASTDAELTAVAGVWDTDATLHYQWQRDHKNLRGQTRATYTLKPGDVGHGIRVRITGTKPGCYSATRYSPTVRPKKASFTAPLPVPKIVGESTVGQVLAAAPGTWSPTPSHLAYRWYRDGTAIKGATHSAYRLTTADAGRPITVRVTATRSGYTTASVLSVPTAPVTA